MTAQEFMNKYKLNDKQPSTPKIIDALDDLYLLFTKEQALAILEDYYNNADEIFNFIHKNLDKSE